MQEGLREHTARKALVVTATHRVQELHRMKCIMQVSLALLFLATCEIKRGEFP